MSAQPDSRGEQFFQGLPERLRPRESELPGLGTTRLVETTLLLLVGLLLLIATVNDLHRETNVNSRLNADLATWRGYTGHDYKNISISQELLGANSEHDVACGNTSAGAPKTKIQVCLAIWGPVHDGRRAVHGGWYLRANSEDDVRVDRYGCFGAAADGICEP